MAGAGGPSVLVVPAPRPGRVSAPDTFPNVIATTLSLNNNTTPPGVHLLVDRVPTAGYIRSALDPIPNVLAGPLSLTAPAVLPVGTSVYASSPWIKYQTRIDPHPPNLLEQLLFSTLPPFALQLSTSSSSVEARYQIRIDPIPNLTLAVLPPPGSFPFIPQIYPSTPSTPKSLTADQHFAIYQAPPNPAPTTGPPLRMPLPTLKYQVLQEAAPPNNLVRGIPTPLVPVAQPLDANFSEPIKQKYGVYDLNLLWPNRTLPNTIPPPNSVLTTVGNPYDTAFYYKSKGNVYDINYPSSQVPNTIPPGPQNPFLPHVDYYYMRKWPVTDTNTFLEIPARIPFSITVPNVVGMTQIVAFQTLIAAGFQGGITNTLSLTPPFGIVLSQNPIGGSFAPQNSVVNITVAIQGVAVPNVVGLTQSAAIAALTASSLSAIIQTSFNSGNPIGTVVSQTPLSGTIVQLFTSVIIVVAGVFGGAGPIYGSFSGNIIQGTFN